jgi:threonine dehydrogenase-like Zn-dependent dehydrogenase
MRDETMPDERTDPPGSLETVAVLGAGTMGHGIAQVAAQAGIGSSSTTPRERPWSRG